MKKLIFIVFGIFLMCCSKPHTMCVDCYQKYHTSIDTSFCTDYFNGVTNDTISWICIEKY